MDDIAPAFYLTLKSRFTRSGLHQLLVCIIQKCARTIRKTWSEDWHKDRLKSKSGVSRNLCARLNLSDTPLAMKNNINARRLNVAFTWNLPVPVIKQSYICLRFNWHYEIITLWITKKSIVHEEDRSLNLSSISRKPKSSLAPCALWLIDYLRLPYITLCLIYYS